ncbi:CobW family GTP-binding protein [Zhaonella formicivorans]|uniref:CobW family GTP-binding protein n=1 Tax=Zhaonella formicivorans TaxID=2528593 RepID=UPI0010F16875|nr:GTP-binding protein [Zhaonella formicivorans]
MDVYLVGGFLGSGKTTVIRELSLRLAETERRVAIIVNDFGEIGVDGKFLGATSAKVLELYSGCICCQLTGDLVKALDELKHNYNPDVVIIEPSGIADSSSVMQALNHYSGDLGKIITITLVDAPRFLELWQVIHPLIRKQIETAEVIFITKCQLLKEAEQLSDIANVIADIAPTARVIPISLLEGYNVNEMIRVFIDV